METLKEIAENQIKKSFIKEYQNYATIEEGLGLAISRYFEWDGLAILKTMYSALEDANFHSENQIIAEMINKIEKGSILNETK